MSPEPAVNHSSVEIKVTWCFLDIFHMTISQDKTKFKGISRTSRTRSFHYVPEMKYFGFRNTKGSTQ